MHSGQHRSPNEWGLYFAGHLTIETVVSDLLNKTNFAKYEHSCMMIVKDAVCSNYNWYSIVQHDLSFQDRLLVALVHLSMQTTFQRLFTGQK